MYQLVSEGSVVARAALKSLGFIILPRRYFHLLHLYFTVRLTSKLLLWERRPDCTEVFTLGSLGLGL